MVVQPPFLDYAWLTRENTGNRIMNMKSLADHALTDIGKAMSGSLTEDEAKAVTRIIEETLAKAVSQTAQNCKEKAVVCCGPEADIAHKLSEEMDRARHALIANLTSMR